MMRTEVKEKLSNGTMQEGTMREEEKGDDEGGQQWACSAGKGCLFFNFCSFFLGERVCRVGA